jgi:hypothetical protein
MDWADTDRDPGRICGRPDRCCSSIARGWRECHGKLTEGQLRELADVWTAVGLAEAPDTSYGA